MNGDTELLRRYVEERSEAAFAELVRLHLNLVYFSALRQVRGDAHRAKDVAQSVFTDLARKAVSLTGHTTLTGWLHTSTRFAAAKVRRADFTRRQHEHEATTMNALLEPDPAADWERLRPMIDDVIHELDERDREAVLLRFFENRPFADIGATLRLSEDAARMRVDRALEKLRAALARRGVKSTAAALAAVFANQLGATGPAGLAGAITGAALAATAAGGLATAGAEIFMSTTTTTILSAVVLAAMGSTFFQWTHAQRAEAELAALTADRDSVRAQFRADQQRATRSAQDFAALQGEVEALRAKQAAMLAAPPPAPKVTSATPLPGSHVIGMAPWEIQQATLNNLRQINAARKQYQLENGRFADSIHSIVGRGSYIKTVRPVDGEDYSKLSMNPDEPLTVATPSGMRVTFDPKGVSTTKLDMPPDVLRAQEMGARLQPLVNQAVEAYRSANGKPPANERALIPYFTTPKDGADFVEFLEAKKAAGL